MTSSEDLDFQPFVRGPVSGAGKRVPVPRSSLGNDSPISHRKVSLPTSPDIPSIPNLDSTVDVPLPPRPSEYADPHASATAMPHISNPKPIARMARMTPYGGGTPSMQQQKHHPKKGGGVLSVFTSSKKRAASVSAASPPPPHTFRPSMLSKPIEVGLRSPSGGGTGVAGKDGKGGGGKVPPMVKRRSRSAPPNGLPTLGSPKPDDPEQLAMGDVGEGEAGALQVAEDGTLVPAVVDMIRSVSENARAVGVVAIGAGGVAGVGLGTIDEVGVGAEVEAEVEAEVGGGGGVQVVNMIGMAVGEGYDIAVFFQAPDPPSDVTVSEPKVEDREDEATFVFVEAAEEEGDSEGEEGGGGSVPSLPLPVVLTPGVSRWDTKEKQETLPGALESQPVVAYSDKDSGSPGSESVGSGGELAVGSAKPRKVSKFEKEEAHTTLKALSRILKDESKMNKHTLKLALQELEGLHRVHKESMKQEANAITAHSKVKSEYTKVLSAVEGVRREVKVWERKLETADIDLKQADESLETHKERVREAMAGVKHKKDEVDALRALHGAEERDRASQLHELKKDEGSESSSSSSGGGGTLGGEGGGEAGGEAGKREGRKKKKGLKKEGKGEGGKHHHKKKSSKLGLIGLAPLYPPAFDKPHTHK